MSREELRYTQTEMQYVCFDIPCESSDSYGMSRFIFYEIKKKKKKKKNRMSSSKKMLCALRVRSLLELVQLMSVNRKGLSLTSVIL